VLSCNFSRRGNVRKPTTAEVQRLKKFVDNYEYFIGACECCLTGIEDEEDLKVAKEIIRSVNEDSDS
jgi:hypothetical protein